jgi:hypothetical protein
VPLDPVVGRPLQDAEVRAMPSAQSSDVIGPELPAGQLAGILRSGRSVMAQGKTTVVVHCLCCACQFVGVWSVTG